MTHKLLNRIGLLLGALSLPLMAGEPKLFYASGAIINSQGDLRTITRNPLGFGGEVGFHYSPADFGIDLVGHVGYLVINQDKKDSISANATAKAGHFGAGLSYPVGKLPASVEVGLIMHTWDISNLYSPTGGKGETSWKLGARVIVTYDISDRWGANLGYTFSEYVTGLNPSYVSAGVTFRF